MKIDREYFENEVFTYGKMKGEKLYSFEKIGENIGMYIGPCVSVVFELDTLERIGGISESDVRCSWNRYYTATYNYGWDGKRSTKKEFTKTLCTRGDYSTARSLLLQEYKNR